MSVIVAVLVSCVAAAVVVRRGSASESTHRPEITVTRTYSGLQPSTPVLAPLDEMTDPEAFARRVAQVLFEWDTTQFDARRLVVDRLVAVGDPSGESAPGLVSDIENYLPPVEAWADLQQYETRQDIEVRTVAVPTQWAWAQRQAGADVIVPGTVAYTIHGILHRDGVWEGRDVSSHHPIAFTVFVVCAPAYEECHLLRLSLPDTPLK